MGLAVYAAGVMVVSPFVASLFAGILPLKRPNISSVEPSPMPYCAKVQPAHPACHECSLRCCGPGLAMSGRGSSWCALSPL